MVINNKKARIALWVLLIFGIFASMAFMYSAIAVHVVKTNEGATFFSVNEDVAFTYNITINNTDSAAAPEANITQVNMTLSAGLIYQTGTQLASADGVYSFLNTSTVLSWENESGLIIAGDALKYFSFVGVVLTPGQYNISVTTVNASGTSNSNISVTVNDTTKPLITINSPGNTTYPTSSITFNATTNENSTCNYTLDTGINNVTMINSGDGRDFNQTNTSVGDGSYRARFYCLDIAGNKNFTEYKDFSVDTTAPRVTINLPANTSYTSSVITFNATTNENSTCNYTLNAGINNVTLIDSGNGRDFNKTNTSIADGSYRARFYCLDIAGNKNFTEYKDFAKDTIAPLISIIYPLTGNNYTTAPTALNYTVSGAASCWYFNGTGNTTITCGANATGLSPSQGSNTWRTYANDSAGNLNTSSITFTLDSAAPQITINSPTNTTYTVNQTTMNITTDENATCWFTLDTGTNNITMQSGNNLNFNYTNTSIGNANYKVIFYCNDTLNNINGTTSVNFTISYTPATETSSSTGGGLATNTGATYTVTETQLAEGVEKELRINDKFKFTIDSESHSARLLEVTSTTAKVEISSTPQTATLNIGDSRKFEVTGDDYYDVKVTLEGITGVKANIILQSIYEKVTVEAAAEEVAKEEAAAGAAAGEEAAAEETGKAGGKSYTIWIIIAAVVAVVIVIALLLARRKNKRHYR